VSDRGGFWHKKIVMATMPRGGDPCHQFMAGGAPDQPVDQVLGPMCDCGEAGPGIVIFILIS